jgi:hypothetical protein
MEPRCTELHPLQDQPSDNPFWHRGPLCFQKNTVREVFFRGEGGEKGIYPSN